MYSLEPPRRGGSNEYPQSMFLSKNKKNNVYPCKPQFYYKKWGLRGSILYRQVFVMMTMVLLYDDESLNNAMNVNMFLAVIKVY